MSASLPQLQGLLLDMLSTCRDVDPDFVMALDDADWEIILGMVRQHRLGPMLHWRLARERRGLPVPQTVSDDLAASFRKSSLRALSMQRELLLTHRILEQAGIPHLALKGAYLAYHAYPHPALRPLRDLDILVPNEWTLKAYRLLIEKGLSRKEQFPGCPEAWLQTHKHLPPLRSASGQASIELHSRLSHPEHAPEGHADHADDPLLWSRAIDKPIAGETLAFMSTTDLLLHLIEHAVYDHRFDNGPLTLCDLAFLLETHPIDWPHFWRQAEKTGRTRGCLLMLKMVERYFGAQPVAWPETGMDVAAPMNEMVVEASLLTLQNFEIRGDMTLESELRDQAGLGEKLGYMLRKAFPPRKSIAAHYPVSQHSARVYFWYLARWRRLAKRLPEYLQNRLHEQTRNEARQLSRLQQWLEKSAG